MEFIQSPIHLDFSDSPPSLKSIGLFHSAEEEEKSSSTFQISCTFKSTLSKKTGGIQYNSKNHKRQRRNSASP